MPYRSFLFFCIYTMDAGRWSGQRTVNEKSQNLRSVFLQTRIDVLSENENFQRKQTKLMVFF